MATITVSAGQSIQAAVTSAASGDTVQIETGVFNESIQISTAITLKRATGHTPVIRGASATDYIIRLLASGITVDGLTISLNPTHANPTAGTQTWGWVNIERPNCVVKNCTIYLDGVTDRASAEAAYNAKKRYRGIRFVNSGNSGKVQDCTISGVAMGVHVGAVTNALIEGCEIFLTQQSCIVIANTTGGLAGNVIQDNILRDSAIEDGVQFVQNFNAPNPATVTENKGTIIRRNLIYGHGENAVDLKGTSYIVIEDNCIYGNIGSNNGYLSGGNRNALGIITCGSGASTQRVIIRGNTIIDGAGHVRMHPRFSVYHNVLIANNRDYTGSDSSASANFSGLYQQSDGLDGLLVSRNNIIGGHHLSQSRIIVSGSTDWSIDGNIYFSENGANNFIDRPGLVDTNYTFSQWVTHLSGIATVAGKEAHSLFFTSQASVLFADGPVKPQGPCSNHDFRLAVGSPGLGAAVPLTTVVSVSGANVTVGNGDLFCDGFGSTNAVGDTIYVNSQTTTITAVNGNVLTVSPSITASPGAGVYWRGTGGLNIGLITTGSPPPTPVTLDADFTWSRVGGSKALFAAANGDIYAGDSRILRSTDSGDTWSVITTPGGNTACRAFAEVFGRIYAAFATDGAAASASGLYYTTNGTSWTQEVSNVNFYSLARSNSALYAGASGNVYEKTSASGTPTALGLPLAGNVAALAISPGGALIIADAYNVYRRSGGTLTPTEVESAGTPTALLTRNAATGPDLILGTNSEISVSWDDGLTWERVRPFFNMVAGYVLADGSVLASDDDRLIYLSRDGGLSFEDFGSGFDTKVYAFTEDITGTLFLVDASHIYRRVTVNGELTMGPLAGEPVYVANKRTFANLTHLKVYDESSNTYTTYTPATFAGAALLPLSPAVDDAFYAGVQSDVVDGGPFHNLIFALSTINISAEFILQYYNGTAWVEFNPRDNTGGLRRSGSIVWGGLTDWAPVAVNGVTAYWVRFIVDAVGSVVARPVLANLYSATQPYIDVAVPGGDIDALATLELIPQSDYSNNGAILAIRSLSRGADFSPYLVMARSQNAAGVRADPGPEAEYIIDTQSAAAGEYILHTPQTASAWLVGSNVTVTYGTNYRGDFQLYARLKFTGSADTVQVRGVVDGHTGEPTYLTPWSELEDDYAQLVHLGPFHVHDRRQFDEAAAPLTLAIEVNSANSGDAEAVRLYELILMPADEWIGRFIDPGNNSVEMHLIIDSARFPKRSLRAFSVQRGTRFIVSNWRSAATGPFVLKAGEAQRIWLLSEDWAGQPTLASQYPVLYRAKLWTHERWVGLRGDE